MHTLAPALSFAVIALVPAAALASSARSSVRSNARADAVASAACSLHPAMTSSDGRSRPVDVSVDGRGCAAPSPGAVAIEVTSSQGEIVVDATGDAAPSDLDALAAASAEEIAARAKKRGRRNFPERRGGVTDAGGAALAFMSVVNGDCSGWFCFNPQANGGGLVFSASVAHRFESPLVVGAVIDSAGFVAASSVPTTGAFTGYAFGGLDTRFLELGAGVGAVMLGDGTTDPMIVTRARLGALDGLHLSGSIGFVPAHAGLDGRSQDVTLVWALGAQFPLADKLALEIDAKFGGAANDGLAGTRLRVAGDGGAGSIWFTSLFGIEVVAGAQADTSGGYPIAESHSAGGLALSFGLDWRL